MSSNRLDNVSLLTKSEVVGLLNKLDIFKVCGTKCALTDYSILLGAQVYDDEFVNGGREYGDRTGWYYTQNTVEDEEAEVNEVHIIDGKGKHMYTDVYYRVGGARLCMPFSSLKTHSFLARKNKDGIREVVYGEYPQTVESEDVSKKLSDLYRNGELEVTGKKYSADATFIEDADSGFKLRTFDEYYYNGEKYIRFIGDDNCEGEKLSNGEFVSYFEEYWVKVEPVVWFLDEDSEFLISKKLLFSGIRFNAKDNYYGFDCSDMKNYIDYCFSREIIPSKYRKEEVENKNVKSR